MSLMEVKNLGFSYHGKSVFKDISFSLDKGEIFCLLGPNGSGKTTLLDCILGILKPDSGSILVKGMDTCEMKKGEQARFVSYVPQGHDGTFPYTVLDMVLMGRAAHIRLFSSPSLKDREIAKKALDQVGIIDLQDRSYASLSGGESQLVLIARALAQDSPVIIMDEPTAHLDFRHEFVILETILSLVRDKRISVIMATHFPDHAFYFDGNNILTRVAMLNQGSFIKTGSPDDVITKENIKALYNISSEVVSIDADNNEVMRKKHVIPVKA